MRTYLLIPFLALLASCVAAPAPEHQGEWVEGAYCETGVFKLDVDFSGANMAACDILDERTIAIDLKPEDVPINCNKAAGSNPVCSPQSRTRRVMAVLEAASRLFKTFACIPVPNPPIRWKCAPMAAKSG